MSVLDDASANSRGFDKESFQAFLGRPRQDRRAPWGRELHYGIEAASLGTFHETLVQTLYTHHSSFDLDPEMRALGFPWTADYLRAYRSGLPEDHNTQMCNFGEVMGAEYGRWILGYRTTPVLSKRFNPNKNQSMKGPDILGLASHNEVSRSLLGEAKCRRKYSVSALNDAYDKLVQLFQQPLAIMLHFWKEVLQHGTIGNETGIDHLYYARETKGTRSHLILLISEDGRREPFAALDKLCEENPLPNLTAVHIQAEGLCARLPTLFDRCET